MKNATDEQITHRLAEKIRESGLSQNQQDTLLEIFSKPPVEMDDERFRRPSVMRPIMETHVEVIQGTTPSAQDEQTLFLQMNYLRYKLGILLRRLKRQPQWDSSEVQELLDLYDAQLEARSRIVTCNMGLVLAMAKRVNSSELEFTDLISEGSMALLRATEKFDCSRGWKFSTYACRAILKAFSRVAKQNYRYRSRFPAQLDTTMLKDDSLDQKRAQVYDDLLDDLKDIMDQNLAELSDMERSIVDMRFSLSDRDRKPLTLKQVGDLLGLTKERIRQIQKKALGKLRVVTEERMVTHPVA